MSSRLLNHKIVGKLYFQFEWMQAIKYKRQLQMLPWVISSILIFLFLKALLFRNFTTLNTFTLEEGDAPAGFLCYKLCLDMA